MWKNIDRLMTYRRFLWFDHEFHLHHSAVAARLHLVTSKQPYKDGHRSLSDFTVLARIGEVSRANRKFSVCGRDRLIISNI